MKFAFCIGNGPNRNGINIAELNEFGPTYGCNRLIDEVNVDNLIVVDRPLLTTLIASGVVDKTNLYTRQRWASTIDEPRLRTLPVPIEDIEHRWDSESQWGSGTHALNLACSHGAEIVVMIGYDIWGDLQPGCWIHQISKCLEKFPECQFVQIQPANWKIPEEWNYDNFHLDTVSGLKKILKDFK